MSLDIAETKKKTASPPRSRRARWFAVGVALAGALYLAAIWSTHVTFTASAVRWSGPVPGKAVGLSPITAAERAWTGAGSRLGSYRQVLWAARPGGEVALGFDLHNGGPVPVTVLGLRLPGLGSGVIDDLAPGLALLGPGTSGTITPFHPVTLAPGGSAGVGLTEHVVCDPAVRHDARLPGHRGHGSWMGDATSPVVVRYRALGVPTSETLALTAPMLVVMPYRSCE